MTSLARRSLRVVICAPLVVFVTMACSGGTEPLVNTPIDASVTLEAVTPTNLTATVGTAVLPSPAVRVRDKAGRPKPGVTVWFKFNYLNGESTTRSLTDADGVASGPYVLGKGAGAGSVTAYVDGAQVTFSLTGVAGPVAEIKQIQDTARLALNGQWAGGLRTQVVDAFGNPIAGTTVRFTVVQGGGRFTTDSAITDEYGRAVSGEWILGDAGSNRAVARAGTVVSYFFEATALLPGSGAIDGDYTLSSLDGHTADEQKWTGAISLKSNGHWSAFSRWACCDGSVQAYQGAGVYAISNGRIVLSLQTGNWLDWSEEPFLPEQPVHGVLKDAMLDLTTYLYEYDLQTIWSYHRTP